MNDPDPHLIKERMSPQGVAALGVAGFFCAAFLANWIPFSPVAPLLNILCVAAPMIWANLWLNRTHEQPSSGLRIEPERIDWQRVSTKTIGFLGTLLLLGCIYGFLPEYQRPFYSSVWQLAVWLVIPAILGAIPYIAWVDRRMVAPLDGNWHFGRLIQGKWAGISWTAIREHLLGWAVKGFFLPFMLAGVGSHFSFFSGSGFRFETFHHLYLSLLNTIYTLDTVLGVVGYLCTSRILNAHIRSTEPTLLGWASALICYAPFSGLWVLVFKYKGETDWQQWLFDSPVIYITWGFVILLLHVVYVWATCSFGCRFSNLTNRGIITEGPYRYTKHPAYLAKNIAWWLMAVPFIAHETLGAKLWACFSLLMINLVYALRAWTEERHLRRDPEYQRYAAWIRENGLFAVFFRKLRTNPSKGECTA